MLPETAEAFEEPDPGPAIAAAADVDAVEPGEPTRFIFIDTETSGLQDFKKPADDPSQPYLAQLAIIYLDDDLLVSDQYAGFVQPDGWTMEPGATGVNGLTDEFLKENGQPVQMVLARYVAAVEAGYCVAAHNAQFDCKIVRGALRRLGQPDLFEQTRNFCTMRLLAPAFNEWKKGNKWPKLAEALEFCGLEQFGFNTAHEALVDAFNGARILRWMRDHAEEYRQRGIELWPVPRIHYAKNPPAGKEAQSSTG